MFYADQTFSNELLQEQLTSLFTAPQGSSINIPTGKALAVQGQEVSSIFRIDRGYVRIAVYTEDGMRRIIAFAGVGSIIGLDQLNKPTWNVAVEAVTQCVATGLPKAFINRKIEADCRVRDGVLSVLQSEIEQREAHLVMMGVLPSSERVFGFLSAFAALRERSGFLVLPMCRRDIGDYLGLSMETVSRSFSALKESGRIELKGAERFRIVSDDTMSGDRAA